MDGVHVLVHTCLRGCFSSAVSGVNFHSEGERERERERERARD